MKGIAFMLVLGGIHGLDFQQIQGGQQNGLSAAFILLILDQYEVEMDGSGS